MKQVSFILFLILASLVSAGAQVDKDKQDNKAQMEAMQQAMAAIMGNQNCEIAADYPFDHDFDMTISQYDKKGKMDSRMTMRCFLNDAATVLGYEILNSTEKKVPPAKMILEAKSNKMVTLVDQDGQKMAICMDLNNPMFSQGRGVDDPMGEMTRTGRTKTILDQLCEEWQMDDEQATTSFWIAKKSSLPMARFYATMESMQSSPFGNRKMPTNGMMMLMESVAKKSNDKTVMEVTALHPQRKSKISTSGYQKL